MNSTSTNRSRLRAWLAALLTSTLVVGGIAVGAVPASADAIVDAPAPVVEVTEPPAEEQVVPGETAGDETPADETPVEAPVDVVEVPVEQAPAPVEETSAQDAPAAAVAAAIPTLAVSPDTALDPDGQTVTVTGTGYDPALSYYVILCADRDISAVNFFMLSSPDCLGTEFAKRVTPTPGSDTQVQMQTDGSFEFPLAIPASASLLTGASLYTVRDHTGMNDRSGDVKLPLTFAAVVPEPVTPTIVVSKTTDLDRAGETITVTGSGFVPSAPATSGTRPPLAGKFTGAYVVFGKFADAWKPTENAPTSARTGLSTKWAVLAEDMATIGGANSGAVEVKPDGTFEVTLDAKLGDELAAGNYGVYTYPGGGAKYAPFETYTPVTFAALPPEPVTPTVVVSKTADLDRAGETITVTGSGFVASAPATSGTRPPLAGKFTGAYVVFGKFADTWKPTENAPTSARTGLSTKWAVLAEDMATIGGANSGAVEIKPDGTFEVTLDAKLGDELALGNYGVYTYPGGGAKYAPFETYTPVTFAAVVPAIATEVSVVADPATDLTEGDSTTLTATVTPADAVGAVQFRSGDTVITSIPVTNGTASTTITGLTAGDHTYTAAFVPTDAATYLGSQGTTSITVAEGSEPPVELDGSLSWGVKQDFYAYITGPIAQGSVTVDGATLEGHVVTFAPTGKGTYSHAAGLGSATYGGSVNYSGHHGALNITLTDPEITLTSGTTATLTVASSGMRVPFATLNLSGGIRTVEASGAVSFRGVPAVLTSQGASVFGGSYAAGTALDAVDFDLPAPKPAGGATLTVTPQAGLDRDGELITVTGTGYEINRGGTYAQIGWIIEGQWTPLSADDTRSANRTNAYATIVGAGFPGYPEWTVAGDGTGSFTWSQTIDAATLEAKRLAGGTLAVFTLGSHSNWLQPANERFAPISFADVTPVAVATTTALIAAPAAGLIEGDSTTLTATVSPSDAAGSVEFRSGTTIIASAPVNAGVATATSTALTAGSHTFTGVFTPTNSAAFTGSEATTTVQVAPKPTTPVDPTAGTLNWAVKAAFNAYVTGPIAQGTITGDRTFARVPGGSFSAVDGTGTIDYSGSVSYSGHGGTLALTFANPTVDIETAAAGTLHLTVNGTRVAFATLDLTGATRTVADDGVITYSGVAAILTTAGSTAFGGFYPAGTELDALSFAVAGAPQPTEGATLTVTPRTDLARDGATITVSGSGYEINTGGIYAQIGWIVEGAWTPLSAEDTRSANRSNAYAALVGSGYPRQPVFTVAGDGTGSFEWTVTIDAATLEAKRLAGGTLAVFTLGSHSNWVQPANERYVPISFAAEPVAAATTTALTAAPASGLIEGATTELTATVSPANAAGTVEFSSGASVIGSATVKNGVATATTAKLAVGVHTFTAVFTPANSAAFTGSQGTVSVQVAPKPTTPVDPTAGALAWTIKQAFNDYVTGPIAKGSIAGDRSFAQATTGSYSVGSGVGTIDYLGSVRYIGHDGELDLTFANPTVDIESATAATLHLTVNGTRVAFATLDLAAGDRSVADDGVITHESVAAVLTGAGATAFTGFYAAGTDLDPITFSIGGTEQETEGATLTVTPRTGLDPEGATVTVSGSGYEINEGGIYAQIGWIVAGEWTPLSADDTRSANRTNAYATIVGAGFPGYPAFTVAEDGTGSFEWKVDITQAALEAKRLEGGTLAVFTLGSHSNWVQPANERFVTITFADSPATATSVALTASPTAGLIEGASTTLTAAVSPADAAGAVEFRQGEQRIATVDVANGAATATSGALAVGTTEFTAVFTPTDAAAFTGSQGTTTVTAAAKPAPPVNPAAGSLDWTIKQAFNDYVTGPIAKGSISGDRRFGQASGGTYSAATGVGTSNYVGSVSYTGHAGELALTFSNPTVDIHSSSSATLHLSVSGARVAFATLDLASAGRSVGTGGAVTFSSVPAVLTDAGATTFNGFYSAGTGLDAVTFTIGSESAPGGGVSTASAASTTQRTPAATPPTTEGLTITSTGPITAGSEITATAEGFQPNESGILVVIYSEPTVLATNLTADAQGVATWTGRLPANLTGQHTLTFQGSVTRGVVIDIAASTLAAAGCLVDDAVLTWGFKESFRSYVSGSIANGEWVVSEGATYETPNFGFAGGAGSFDPESGEGELGFAGAITFTGHGGVLNTTVSNPKLRFLDADTAVLLVDISGTTQDGAAVQSTGVEFLELDLAGAVEISGDIVTITDAAATLSAAGAAAFGTYPEGEAFDPVNLTFTVADCAMPDEDAATVEPTDEAEVEVTSDTDSGPGWLLWVIGGLILLALIVLVIVLLARKKRD